MNSLFIQAKVSGVLDPVDIFLLGGLRYPGLNAGEV